MRHFQTLAITLTVNYKLLLKLKLMGKVGIKTGYMAYHDPEFFFVYYTYYFNIKYSITVGNYLLHIIIIFN